MRDGESAAVSLLLDALEREKAENARLREALEQIDKKALQAGGGGPYGGPYHVIHDIARNALKEGT